MSCYNDDCNETGIEHFPNPDGNSRHTIPLRSRKSVKM